MFFLSKMVPKIVKWNLTALLGTIILYLHRKEYLEITEIIGTTRNCLLNPVTSRKQPVSGLISWLIESAIRLLLDFDNNFVIG